MSATIHHGDCVTWLRSLPPGGADALITDPPYSSGGAFRSDRTGSTAVKYLESDALPDFFGDNRDGRGFVAWAHLWLSAAHDALRDGSFVAVFTDWRMLPAVTDAVQAGGFVWRGIVPWHKPIARPQRGRPTAACEYVVWGSKGPMPTEGKTHPGLLTGSPPGGQRREHQTEKPVDVLRALVRVTSPGALVLDPFAGSGSLGEAVLLEDRRYLGCELSPHYVEVARRRVADVRPQVGLL